jgi:hypothetical protein
MKSINETGHAKNVANFEDLISFCTAYGTNYNPSKNAIKVNELNNQFILAQNAIAQVTTTKNAFDNVTGIRQTVFANLRPLATKIINALSATDAPKTVIKDAKTINKKLQGRSSTKKGETLPTETPSQNNTGSISTSQQSYDRLIDSFNKLVDLVSAESKYAPNEPELKIASLNNILQDLKIADSNVIAKYTDYSNARIERDKQLYSIADNLVETAYNVKKYVKSVFGASSPQYKQVSGIKFTRPQK